MTSFSFLIVFFREIIFLTELWLKHVPSHLPGRHSDFFVFAFSSHNIREDNDVVFLRGKKSLFPRANLNLPHAARNGLSPRSLDWENDNLTVLEQGCLGAPEEASVTQYFVSWGCVLQFPRLFYGNLAAAARSMEKREMAPGLEAYSYGNHTFG